jgi:hypothetical protein
VTDSAATAYRWPVRDTDCASGNRRPHDADLCPRCGGGLFYGYETRPESATFWEAVPEQNKRLMIHVVGNLLARKIIERGRFGPIPQAPTLRGRGG